MRLLSLVVLAVTACSGDSDWDFDDEAYLDEAARADCGSQKCDSDGAWSGQRFAGSVPVAVATGWSDETLARWGHQDQGVTLLPLSWALALERPDSDAPFFTLAELGKHGLLPAAPSAGNRDGLPLGLAVHERDGRRMLGFTCAVCHTADLTVGAVTLRFPGAQGRVDVGAFGDALADAFRANLGSPAKAYRLIARIVRTEGLAHTPRVARDIFDTLVEQARAWRYTRDLYPVAAGPGRTDAIGLGGGRVFGDAIDPANYAASHANVSIPPLWDVPRFDWAQYNGAIRQPLARNVVQALGVGADVELRDDDRLFASSIDFAGLLWLEQAAAELTAPTWPAAFGPVDPALVAEGRAVYVETCARCHGDLDPAHPARLLAATPKFIATDEVGTDTAVTESFATRTVVLSPALYRALGIPAGTRVSAADAFAAVTEGVIVRWFDDAGLDAAERERLRDGVRNEWRAIRAYRARPLAGMWATAPFLHNGSVPDLRELLGPAAARSVVFTTGGDTLDPETLAVTGGRFRFDTRLPGNSNRGHSFEDRAGQGVVGRALAPREVRAVIELLKVLEGS